MHTVSADPATGNSGRLQMSFRRSEESHGQRTGEGPALNGNRHIGAIAPEPPEPLDTLPGAAARVRNQSQGRIRWQSVRRGAWAKPMSSRPCSAWARRPSAEIETNVHEALTPIPADVWREALERIAELDARAGIG